MMDRMTPTTRANTSPIAQIVKNQAGQPVMETGLLIGSHVVVVPQLSCGHA